jgi:hypothetical protein
MQDLTLAFVTPGIGQLKHNTVFVNVQSNAQAAKLIHGSPCRKFEMT